MQHPLLDWSLTCSRVLVLVSVQEVIKMVAASLPEMPAMAQTSAPPPPPSSAGRPPVTLSRLPGNPDTVATVTDFPQRYRRRLMTTEEMDYIQVGATPEYRNRKCAVYFFCTCFHSKYAPCLIYPALIGQPDTSKSLTIAQVKVSTLSRYL